VGQDHHDLARGRPAETLGQPFVTLFAEGGEGLGPFLVGRVVQHREMGRALLADRPVVPEVPGRRQADVLQVAVGDNPPPPVPEEERVVVAVDGVDRVDAREAVAGLHRREEDIGPISVGEPGRQIGDLIDPHLELIRLER
jgi:hypothetical protein